MARPIWTVLAAFGLAAGAAAPAHAQQGGDQVAGLYDGSRAEVAAILELGEDGHYRFQLAYGAFDEWSAGTWKAQGEDIVLQSDPFTPPSFEVEQQSGRPGTVEVSLVLPEGIDAQYFSLDVERRDGSTSLEDFAGERLEIAMGDNPVVSVTPALPMMGLSGDRIPVTAGGASLRISFSPHDFGFAEFAQERLHRVDGDFAMTRHGRVLTFRKVRPVP